MNIYVSNLSDKIKEENLRQIFEEFGQVSSANVITDKYSGESKGFGFVEMNDSTEANTAIEELNGAEFLGKKLIVNEAKPRTNNNNNNRSRNNFKSDYKSDYKRRSY
ncbi:MAG TPA: RNA-binding protein [Bacteroidales bacterium]|nr:RNA-binding protein [Bacteroidales bacterium]HPT03536.1 RNA-binding protein [Bacteroidales bacterium]